MKSIDKIIDLGCVFYAVHRAVLLGRLRDARTSRVRFSVMAALRAEGYPYSCIGAAFNRNHSAVISAIQNVTPEAMAELWPNHVAFLKAIKERDDFEENPLPDVIQATRLALADLDQKLDIYQRTRALLVKTLADLESASQTLRAGSKK